MKNLAISTVINTVEPTMNTTAQSPALSAVA